MWLSKAAVGRIRELEAQLRDSVSGEVYRASLARVAELERRNDWAMDMLLRRGGSLPVPTPQPEGERPPQTEPPALTETQMSQAETVVAEGRRLNMSREEIENAVRVSVPGITEEAIAEALRRDRRL